MNIFKELFRDSHLVSLHTLMSRGRTKSVGMEEIKQAISAKTIIHVCGKESDELKCRVYKLGELQKGGKS